MALIKVYDKIVTTPNEQLLSKEDALAAFNLFIEGKTPQQVFHILCLDLNKLKTLYKRLEEVVDMMERIVKREAWLERPIPAVTHIDEDTGEEIVDVPAVEGELCPVPSTLTKLKERSLQLIQNDYDISESLFETDNVMDLVDAINEVIDKVILNSNVAKNADFLWWREQVINS